MGKVTTQPDQAIQHFSHPHPLQLTNYQAHQTLNLSPCSCCKVPVSGLTYFCQPCNYFLHVKCSQYHQQIKHPFDPNHVFSLLPTPVYPEGLFSCDACGTQGNGFSYHCKPCGTDLHVLCASMPLSITHYSHTHQLNLTFSPPYEGNIFSCDICKTNGSNHWLYRCNFCEFDAHLTCATTKPTFPAHNHSFQQPPPQQQQLNAAARANSLPVHQNSFQMPPPPQRQQQYVAERTNSLPNYRPIDFGNQVSPLGVGYANGQSYGNQMLQTAVDPMAQLLQACIGGGGGTGGNGGGTSQILQALVGGDGGGGGGIAGQLLQSFVGVGAGGGGIGGQLLQSLVGGGGGGGGGGNGGSFDVSSMLGGNGSGGFDLGGLGESIVDSL